MIKGVSLKNFKSHKNTQLELGNLTILAGQNGVGKSSFIQPFLLLRQTYQKGRLSEILDLNAPLCYIGKTRDALYQFPDKEDQLVIEFKLTDTKVDYKWTFDASNESTYLPRLPTGAEQSGAEDLSLFGNNFQYISAARGSLYAADNYAVEIQKQLSINQGRGELTAQFLHHYGKSLVVNKELLHAAVKDPFLLAQTTGWEREISTGVNITPTSVGDGYEIRYSFENETLGETDSFSSQNVGFGLSYALPIIVSILSSGSGALLLIENPEAHLHPYGQAKIAELICVAAEAGVQIVVETHSDHIINGILVQCKRHEQAKRGIERSKVKMYSFDRDEKEHKTIVSEVIIGESARMKTRPDTFFDQFGKDIRYLI